MKYQSKKKKLKVVGDRVYSNNLYLCELNKLKLIINDVLITDNLLIVNGLFYDEFDNCELFFVDNANNKYELIYYNDIYANEKESDNIYKKGFCLSMEFKDVQYLKPTLLVDEKEYVLDVEFGIYAKLNNNFSFLYLRGKNKLLKYDSLNHKFDIYKKNLWNSLKFETKCSVNLLKKDRFKYLFFRQCAKVMSFFKSREIWLITDGINRENDNGESFFKYVIQEQLNPDTKYYFALDKNSSDYKLLYHNYSNVINISSLKYKLLFLIANKVISSSDDEIVLNPFGNKKIYLSDLYNHKLILLSSTIRCNDILLKELVNKKVQTGDDEIFKYDNLDNCKRVYDEIIKL